MTTVVEGDHNIEREVCVAMGEREDPVLNAMLSWLEAQNKTDLRTLLGEHAFGGEG